MRCVVVFGDEPASAAPSWMPTTGRAASSITPSGRSRNSKGRRVTSRPQRATAVAFCASRVSSGTLTNGSLSRSTRCPRSARTAGSSVTATATEVSTVRDAPMPILVMKSRPTVASPTIEIATVVPAKITARPAVEAASPAASFGEAPSWRACRKRVTMNSE